MFFLESKKHKDIIVTSGYGYKGVLTNKKFKMKELSPNKVTSYFAIEAIKIMEDYQCEQMIAGYDNTYVALKNRGTSIHVIGGKRLSLGFLSFLKGVKSGLIKNIYPLCNRQQGYTIIKWNIFHDFLDNCLRSNVRFIPYNEIKPNKSISMKTTGVNTKQFNMLYKQFTNYVVAMNEMTKNFSPESFDRYAKYCERFDSYIMGLYYNIYEKSLSEYKKFLYNIYKEKGIKEIEEFTKYYFEYKKTLCVN